MSDQPIDYLEFCVARAHLDLTGREHRVFGAYMKMYGLFLRTGRRNKVTLQQMASLARLSQSQVMETITDLVVRNIILRVKADTVQVQKTKQTVKHSIQMLEDIVGCDVGGAMYVPDTDILLCLNLNWTTWLFAHNIPIMAAIGKFTVQGGGDNGIGSGEGMAFAKKALDYYCMKFASTYGCKFKASPGSIRKWANIVNLLALRDIPATKVYGLIDFAFNKRAHLTSKVMIDYVAEDVSLFASGLASSKTESDLNIDSDGKVTVKGSQF